MSAVTWGAAFTKFLYGAFVKKDPVQAPAPLAIPGGVTAAFAKLALE